MKKFIFLGILISVLVLAGCGVSDDGGQMTEDGDEPAVTDGDGEIDGADVDDDATADWQTYQNEELGFEVKIPDDWKVMESERTSDTYTPEGMDFSWKVGKSVAFCPVAGCQDSSAEILILTQTTPQEAISKHTDLNAGSDLQTIDSSFLGYESKLATYTHMNVGSEKYKNIAFEKDGVVFFLWGLTDSSVAEDAIFDQMLSTFKFVE